MSIRRRQLHLAELPCDGEELLVRAEGDADHGVTVVLDQPGVQHGLALRSRLAARHPPRCWRAIIATL